MSDGRLWFNTKIDNTGVGRDLRDLERRIQKSQETIAKAENAKLPLVKQLEEAKKKLDGARKSLSSLKADLADTQAATKSQDPAEAMAATAALPEARAMVAAQEKEVEKIQKNWATINDKVAGYDCKIQQVNTGIERNKAKAAELTAQLNSGGAKMQAAFDKARNSANRFGKRLLAIAKSALIFNLVYSALRSVVNYFGKVLKTNSEYTAQLAKLKGALLTAFQPIYEFILPGVLALLKVLTAIVQVAANVLSALFGKSASDSAKNAKALNAEAKAIEGVGDSAKKAQKSLAGFDEINTLGSTKDEAGNGVGDSGVKADFSDFNTEEYKAKIDELTVYLSGALLAVGAILAFSGVNIPLGIALMAVGTAGLASEIAVNWDDMSDDLRNALTVVTGVVGGFALAIGAVLAFSGVALGKGIALMAIGAASLAATAALNWNTITDALQGPIGGIVALLSTALLVLGAVLAFSGGGLALGISLMAVGAAGLVTVTALNWNAIVGALRGPIGGLVALASTLLLVLGIILVCTGVSIPLGIALIAAGAAGLVTVTALNWNTILEKIKGVWAGIKQWWGTSVAPVFTKEYWAEKFSKMVSALPDSWKNAINAVIRVVNKFIGWLNDTLTFDIPPIKIAGVSIFSGGSVSLIKLPSIPYLAQGAVLPPNKPFMAVVGDQKHGTNIEAPLSTIQEAVALVMQDYAAANLAGHEATVAVLRKILEAVLGIEIGDKVIADAVKRYNSKMAVVRGG